MALFSQEIEILRTLRHPNIILMLDWFETKEEICVVTEFAQVHHAVRCHSTVSGAVLSDVGFSLGAVARTGRVV